MDADHRMQDLELGVDVVAAWKGPGIFLHALGVEEAEEVSEERRNEIAAAIQAGL